MREDELAALKERFPHRLEWSRKFLEMNELVFRGCADSSLPGGTVAARVDESTAMTRAFPSGKRVEFTRGGGRF